MSLSWFLGLTMEQLVGLNETVPSTESGGFISTIETLSKLDSNRSPEEIVSGCNQKTLED